MIDWELAVQPLLSGGTSQFTTNNAVAVIEAIVESKEKILDHDPMHECFYSSFIALAGNTLAQFANTIPRDHLKQAVEACDTILRFCVRGVVNYDSQPAQCVITLNDFIHIIMGLCDNHDFQRSDVITFTAMIKSANLPMLVKNRYPSDTANSSNPDESEQSQTSTKKPALTASDLFSFLTNEVSDKLSMFQINENVDICVELKSLNTVTLQDLAIEYNLFRSFLSLPYLMRYVNRHQNAIVGLNSTESLVLPLSANEALAVKNGLGPLHSNLKLVLDATKFPIIEPFNADQLTAHTDVALSCLCAAISVAVAVTVLENGDVLLGRSTESGNATAVHAVKDGINVYEAMLTSLKKSNRFGGHVFQNFQLLASTYLVRGIDAIDQFITSANRKNLKFEVGKISETLRIALSSLLGQQLKDMLAECDSSSHILLQDKDVIEAPYSIELLHNITPTQGFLFLTKQCNIIELLMNSAFNSFIHIHKPGKRQSTDKKSDEASGDEEALDYLDDATTEGSSSSDEDTDSEASTTESLILGAWMVRLMSNDDQEEVQKEEDKSSSSIVPASELPSLQSSLRKPATVSKCVKNQSQQSTDKLESLYPGISTSAGAIQHCCFLLKLLSENILSSRNDNVKNYFYDNLSDDILHQLSAMIFVLDDDGITVGNEGIVLMEFLQKLLTFGKFDEKRRNQITKILLAKSQLLLRSSKLTLGPMLLSILAQSLIHQQHIAKSIDNDSDDVVAFINSIVAHYVSNTTMDTSNDVCVEVFQLVLFLFHTLTENGKKNFFNEVANAFHDINSNNPLNTSRLVVLFDYLLHQFSSPTEELIQQVRWNFFTVHGILATNSSDVKSTTRQKYDIAKKFFSFVGVMGVDDPPKSEKKDKDSTPFMLSMFMKKSEKEKGDTKSKMPEKVPPQSSFYFELCSKMTSPFEDDKREIDEKVRSFLHLDTDKYWLLFSAIIRCLDAGSSLDLNVANQEKDEAKKENKEKKKSSKDSNSSGLGGFISKRNTIRYCFQLSWRLIKSLPFPLKFEKVIDDGELTTESEVLVALHYLCTHLGTSPDDAKTPTGTLDAEPSMVELEASTADERDCKLKQLLKLTAEYLDVGTGTTDRNPTRMQLMVVECAVTQAQTQLWSKLMKGMDTVNPYDMVSLSKDLLPHVLKAVTRHAALCRSHIVRLANEFDSDVELEDGSYESLDALIACMDIDTTRITEGATNISIPFDVNILLTQWESNKQMFKDIKAKKPDESVNRTVEVHLKALAADNSDNAELKELGLSLLLLQEPLHRLCDDLVIWVKASSTSDSVLVCDTLVPLLADITCINGHDQIKQALEKVTGGANGSDEYNDTLNFYALKGAYNILTNHISPSSGLRNKAVAIEYLTYLENTLPNPSMQRALNKFFVPDNATDSTEDAKDESTSKEAKEDNITFKGNVGFHNGSIVELLFSNRLLSTTEYSNELLQFIATLCKTANSADSDCCARLGPVCNQLCSLELSLPEMREWVGNFELDMVSSTGVSLKDEICSALLTLSHFIVSKKSLGVQQLALTLLDAILPDDSSSAAAVATLQVISPMFVVILATLANAHTGSGHYRLLSYALWWLDACVEILMKEDSAEKMHSQSEENEVIRAMQTCSPLLLYVRDVLNALRMTTTEEAEINDGDESDMDDTMEVSFEHECDFEDEDVQEIAPEEEESTQDEDGLWNKLCTYTITQKRFMNQHWYHCHTCDMVDGVGVCTICAKVCHKGHDLSYAKFGSFFCDCGAKDDKSCRALVKRVPGSDKVASGVSAFSDTSRPASASASSIVMPASSSTSTTSYKSDAKKTSKPSQQGAPAAAAQRLQNLINKKGKSRKQNTVSGAPLVVDGCKDKLMVLLGMKEGDKIEEGPQVTGIVTTLLRVSQAMRRVVATDHYKLNSTSSTMRALKAMEDLHNLNKSTNLTDTLMVPTLGSQEGAFENVKANFSGEQGQTIRQLISARLIRRVAMCCLSTSAGRRQYLAVSHEKGKVTLLQLSALLKQADASKRKLTLPRLSTTAMPFAVTTITANPCNEEVLAVCGLKDCHILTFASSPQTTQPAGSVIQHLVLHPQLATNNYIVRVVWLPASPTMIALVTAEFIKIYDLSKDILSPSYYLLLPTGKIRDTTFIGGVQDQSDTCIIVMSSTGHVYMQMLNEESLAVHGTFYLTNILNVTHEHLKESGGQVGGGGASVYYSHTLRLLLFSYTNGRNFAAALSTSLESINNLFCIDYKPSSSARNGSNGSNTLYEWCEVANHPGMITCFSQTYGCPIILMVKPDTIALQEIKVTSTKAKVQDLVAVRHGSSGTDPGERTTVIVLCEDGSLRIYRASSGLTGYWLHPRLRPTLVLGHIKHVKTAKANSSKTVKEETDDNVGFPIDFFENCQVINNNDLEFGGSLLEVYNPAQMKNRLNSTGMYLMGQNIIRIEITQKNTNMVITGLRILIGNQSGLRSPTYCDIDERRVSFGPRLSRPRWFDIPLTRAESIKFHSKITLVCGPSEDPDDYNVIDSLKVYGKTKDAFGWAQEDSAAAKTSSSTQVPSGRKAPSSTKNVVTNGNSDTESDTSGETNETSQVDIELGIADELLYSCLSALNCSFDRSLKPLASSTSREQALELVSDLLVQPLSAKVHANIKRTMTSLFADKASCHKFQDGVLLKYAASVLSNEVSSVDHASPTASPLVDEDSFQRVLSHLSLIARHRPLNLAAQTTQTKQDVKLLDIEENTDEDSTSEKSDEAFKGSFHEQLLKQMMSAFWRLLANKPRNKLLAPPCLPGLTRISLTVKVMIDIIHAISASVPETLDTVTQIYFDLLTHNNPRVSYAAKSALTKLLRMKVEPSHDDANAALIVRSMSKSSETPPSTRSASPPSVTSSNKVSYTPSGAAGRGFRMSDITGERPGSHVSSHGTTGGTIEDDDDEEEDDDEDDDDDDDDDEDDDDDDDFEDLGNDAVGMSIEEQLMGGDDTIDFADASGMQSEEHRFFEQNRLPSAVDESEYSRLLISSHGNGSAEESGSSSAQRMAESRSLTMDMMRAMAAEVAQDDGMDEQDHQDLENMLMGMDFPNLLPQDADDEAMVEYAIALSLQQQEQQEQQQQRVTVQSQPIPTPAPTSRSNERRQSEGGSSSASDAAGQSPNATPSVLDESARTPEQNTPHAHFSEEACIETDRSSAPRHHTVDMIGRERLAELCISVLRSLFSRIAEVEKLGGERSIPYFQVIATLVTTLNFADSSHIELHRHIVTTVMERLQNGCHDNESNDGSSAAIQTPEHEVFVIMMRLLSVMMSKSQCTYENPPKPDTSEVDENEKPEPLSAESIASIHTRTASILTKAKIVDLCYQLLSQLYQEQWKKPLDMSKHKDDSAVTTGLLRSTSDHTSVDMTPFFLHQYVQSHAGAIFEPYLRLITEMALNLSYQVRKHYTAFGSDVSAMFGEKWKQLLSEYMLFAGVPSLVRRRARKLLLYITGSKEKYREERDLHALSCYIKDSSKLCKWGDGEKGNGLSLTYDELIQLVETIKKCCEVAENRTRNWQKYCVDNTECLPFLLDTSIRADESVAANVMKLLLCAISSSQTPTSNIGDKGKKTSKTSVKVFASSKPSTSKESKTSSTMSRLLSQAMMNDIKDSSLQQFIQHFLLEMNTTSIRWSAHAFVLNLFRHSNPPSQERLVNTMWILWPLVATYGRKASQFVDLLGYLSMNHGLSQVEAKKFTDATVTVLHQQNRLLSNHQNAILYSQLANYVQFDGFYLENNPCLVCNQPEIPFTHIKLGSIKGDTKYTTTQQIIKLVGSYTVQKVSIKVTDIKRTKMIRTAVLYYNNKKVPAIVDLKNNPSMWHRAKSITVPQGESEIRFDLPLPIVATNLMLEFTDFYENVSASIETLQCPRCSASVQANPGICSNCGENVFQCHKCRSINYDEKDPYLCNVCGFSKYAKFDINVTARPCCAVDSIENDEDRKKMVSTVVSLLEKADAVYNQLNAHKPQLEALLLQISRISSDTTSTTECTITVETKKTGTKGAQPISLTSGGGGGSSGGVAAHTPVSNNIQQLAKKYCQECKTLFEELSGIMRTVLASRSEIVEYDKRQQFAVSGTSSADTKPRHVPASSSAWCQSAPDCYGCASSSAQQCIALLRVLASNEHAKPILISNRIMQELVLFNLRRGTARTRKQVHSLIGQLIKNNEEATSQLNDLLLMRIIGAINHHGDNLPSSAVAYEMELLMAMLNVRDDLWQLRLRTAMQLFQKSVRIQSPAVVENITLPCVHMLRKLVSPQSSGGSQVGSDVHISVQSNKWMNSEPNHDYNDWRKNQAQQQALPEKKDLPKEKAHELYLQEKYAKKWKNFVLLKNKQGPQKVKLSKHSFLRSMLFCPSSRSVRQAACAVITSLSRNTARKPQVLDLLTSYLDELGAAGEAAAEFLALYQEQIRLKQWRVYLAGRGLLPLLGSLIQREITKLSVLEETTLNLHLQQGYALKELTELLSEMVQVSYVRQNYKSSLVGTVLNSYLSLRRLVIQRTNLVDDAQDVLLELLEELTTGTESETRAFMAVCIEAIKKQDLSDLKTPQFIFERLANIIYPEETDTSEFFLSLDKDPLQEDFLQGRMVGNPYSSNEPGLGPLMRDVKNKICRDCDLIALLEDDSGMELLINNKIIALDLPVRDVYKKIWLPNHSEEDAMHVVYRMRGLLGEATEDIVERLDSDKTDQDEEEVYKLASVLSECGGIEVILTRLESVKSLVHGRQLMDVILKLLSQAVKLKVNRQYLTQHKLNTLNTLLGTLNLGLQAGEEGVSIVDQLLQIMWSILEEAAADKTHQEKLEKDVFTGDKEKLMLLLQQVDSEFVQGHTNILQGLLRIIPFLSFGDPDLMQMLIDHFISTLNFEKYDENHSDDDTVYLNCFCEIVAGIQFNASGNQLKDLMVKNGIVRDALAYINTYMPEHRNFDTDDWKAFTARPGLSYCLRMLTGLCTKHKLTQELVGETAIPGLHRLEQISSEGSIGSHAENVLEALREHPDVAKQVQEVRRQTRAEKKKKAMEVRQQQLGALGMHTNEKGQVISKSTILQQISELVEESGLTCIICREGYKFEPKKVLGIYTYTRRCPLEEFENKPRKQQGYSTVSHFNVVHYDCHTAAVRMARGREEWDSALLQNASTKCNGLLPLWGAQVPEAAFASCLARHNTYIQEATGQREPSFHSTVHDLKLLLLRFAHERSFSEETGGGGRQSNINLIPYLIHAGLYVINTTRNQPREERVITDFLAMPIEKWVESAYEVEGPLFVCAMIPFMYSASKWKTDKIKFFDRIMVLAQARQSSSNTISKLTDREMKDYSVYKPYLIFYGLLHLIVTMLFKNVPEEGGSTSLANYIRHNDNQLLETGEKTLIKFQDEMLVCESLHEFVDVMELHDVIDGDVTDHVKRLFDSLPK